MRTDLRDIVFIYKLQFELLTPLSQRDVSGAARSSGCHAQSYNRASGLSILKTGFNDIYIHAGGPQR